MDSLHQYLTRRMPAAYRELRRVLEGVDAEQARVGAEAGYRHYRFGYGLDGSIEGIVRHVTGWKHVNAVGLATGVWPSPEETPGAKADWEELLEALAEGQAALERELVRRAPEDLSETVTYYGKAIAVADILAHLLEHDQYHAGQICLLRQQRDDEF